MSLKSTWRAPANSYLTFLLLLLLLYSDFAFTPSGLLGCLFLCVCVCVCVRPSVRMYICYTHVNEYTWSYVREYVGFYIPQVGMYIVWYSYFTLT